FSYSIRATRPQPYVPWLRQVQRLFVCFAEFVDEDPKAAESARGLRSVRRRRHRGAVRASRTSRARSEARNTAGRSGMEPGEGRREEDDAHVGVAVARW
ncbi:hypothetical protein, partial [Streptosporangium vulgare]|uniref:hypothetical protein n=1 Tax=Streptosporangium vulgare TaxID=46190 RepID=UPI0031E343B5